MNEREARALAFILAKADNGCSTCTTRLAEWATKAWPHYPWEEWVKAERDKPYDERYDDSGGYEEERVPEGWPFAMKDKP